LFVHGSIVPDWRVILRKWDLGFCFAGIWAHISKARYGVSGKRRGPWLVDYAAKVLLRLVWSPRPESRPSMEMSSSSDSQWRPRLLMRSCSRCSAVAWSKRGNQASGTPITRPSLRSTHMLSASKCTRVALTEEFIPCSLGSNVCEKLRSPLCFFWQRSGDHLTGAMLFPAFDVKEALKVEYGTSKMGIASAAHVYSPRKLKG
jgi:hypothetical protein